MKMRCCLVVCVVLICFEFGIVDTLKSSQKGVCVSKHTVTKTRPKTVLVQTSKWCGPKKCTVKQTRKQKYTVVTNQLMCCKGYVYTSDTDSCAPVCSTGCANGTCIDPDVCHCTEPSYLDPTTKNKCLTHTCDHPCINGQCTQNNTCICKDDFAYYNATHCVEDCSPGLELDSSLKCVKRKENFSSVCEPGKANGTCQCACVNEHCEGDKCVCDKGFVLKNGVCQRCGECRADGTCSATFKVTETRHVTSIEHVPCRGGKGMCTQRVTNTEEYERMVTSIVCCEDYRWDEDNDKCLPDCVRGCSNGTCVSPNRCVCDFPLILDSKNIPNTCRPPVCDTPCTHGTCTGTNKCTCLDGYIAKDTFTCVPKCTNCTNGDCVSPNVCNCHEGYSMKNGICTPQCDDCSKGVCTAPNVCICNDGYERKDGKCKPTCKNDCVNGDCIAPDICQCKDGYEAKDGNKENCRPKCSDCSNGDCSAPNICTCNEGYEKKDNKCKPVCKKPCMNGDCVAPNKCVCYKGFEPKMNHSEVCIPVCKSGCSNNGYCEAPEICKCNPGFELNDNKCSPVCETSCTNATCVAPNICNCWEGFEKVNDETCKPKCELCDNGDCIAPGKCECKKGYSGTDKGCVPTCEETCVNGYCSAPNECSCNSGYTKDSPDSFICHKPCHESCKICKDGECVCEPYMNFINGTCTVPMPAEEQLGVTSTTGLASVQMSWWVGGAVVVLLTVLVLVVINRLWHKRKDFPEKAADDGAYAGSVAYTVPNTLFRKDDFAEEEEEGEETSEGLLDKEANVV